MRSLPVFVVMIAVLAACSTPPPPPPPAPSPEPVVFKDTAELLSSTRKAGNAKSTVRAVRTTVFDGATSVKDCRYHLESSGMALSDCRLTDADQNLRMLSLNDTFYLELPPDLAAQTGKPWARVNPWWGKSRLEQWLYTVPDKMLSPLEIEGDLPRLSEITSSAESLNGRPTTRYRSTVRIPDAMAVANSDEDRAVWQQRMDKGFVDFSVDVWVDADGLLAEVETDVPDVDGGRIITTTVFSEWGAEVDLTPPTEDQIGPLPES